MDYKEALHDHEKRLRRLEESSIRLGERLESLCKQLAGLANWIKTLVILLLTSFTGFFIWYVQSLAK